MRKLPGLLSTLLLAIACLLQACAKPAAPVLPSWQDTAARAAIIDFVDRVTAEGGAEYLEPEARIAVFDNDGTLWAEQPLYFQFFFALDRLRELAGQHPDWQAEQPYAAALAGDVATLQESGLHGIVEVVMASHAGMDTVEFAAQVSAWLAQAQHPRFQRPYAELTYLPMVELLRYLEANDFRNYIVTGGGAAFVRALAPDAYGIPVERVVGSRLKLEYESRDGAPRVARLPELVHVNDKGGKPVGIMQLIGRRPVFAAGNSDGDLQMLEWTTAGPGPRFGLLVHHTDAEREWAYDRDSTVGRLDQALDLAPFAGWTVVDMARDWRRVFAFE